MIAFFGSYSHDKNKMIYFLLSFESFIIYTRTSNFIYLLKGVSKLVFCSLISSLKNINIPASIIIIHPIIVLNVGMSLNKRNPITTDQTIIEYSNIEVTDVEYDLYALNTQVNAMVDKTPITRINFQV